MLVVLYCDDSLKMANLISCFGVLVGAFSDFGRADTGKPVQIYGVFWILEAFLEFVGLI